MPRKILVICLVFASVCGLLPSHVTSAQRNRRLIFEETFGRNHTGWQLVTDNGNLEVSADTLSITSTGEGKVNWITPALTVPEDIDIEIEGRVVNGRPNSDWNVGVLLRANDRTVNSTFYHFGIDNQGTWQFGVRRPNPENYIEELDSGRLVGFAPLRGITLRVSARGNSFSFSINGRLIRQFTDTSLGADPNTEHYFGIMTGTFSGTESNTFTVRRIAVYEPEPVTALLRDNFSGDDPESWGTSDNVVLGNGALTISVPQENYLVWTTSRKIDFPSDLDVTVIAEDIAQGPDKDWHFNIGVRAYREGNLTFMYMAEVRGTGEFMIYAVQVGGEYKELETVVPLTPIPGFDSTQPIQLRFVARGSTFTGYVNGREIGTGTSTALDTYDEYGLALAAGTLDAPSAQIAFRELVVSLP
ncbi:MAG: hypothetical protein OHK0023_12150 [Anaerolineae bacterium]